MVQKITTALRWAEVNIVLKLFMFIDTCIDVFITVKICNYYRKFEKKKKEYC